MSRKLIVVVLASAIGLLAQPEKTAWEVLKQDLSDKNPDKRRQAVTAIGSIGLTQEAVQLVEKALKDDDPLVRQTAAAELGEMKSKQSIPALKTELDDPSGEVAFGAAKALWVLGDRSGRELIEDVLTGQQKTSDGLVGGAVRDAKRKMRDPKALAMMGFKEASGALLGPFSLGIVAAEQAFKDGSGGSRTLSVTLLAEECDAQTVRLLEWAFANDKNFAVKAAAAKGLGKCGNRDSIPKLETGLSDSHEAVKAMSAAAIIRLSLNPEQKASVGQPLAAAGL
ncbi:MAG: HEAT repeat domain-containing protein [Acidobacteriia bacterium]|nr:HEAT repeat domain-containing protein [Terriglobia bacterium]